MASPSAGDLETQLKNAVDVLQSSLVGLASTAATKVDTYQDSIESDFATAQSASASAFRSACSSALDHAASMLAPILVGYNHHIVNAPETDA